MCCSAYISFWSGKKRAFFHLFFFACCAAFNFAAPPKSSSARRPPFLLWKKQNQVKEKQRWTVFKPVPPWTTECMLSRTHCTSVPTLIYSDWLLLAVSFLFVTRSSHLLPWRCGRLLPVSSTLDSPCNLVSLADPCWCDVHRSASGRRSTSGVGSSFLGRSQVALSQLGTGKHQLYANSASSSSGRPLASSFSLSRSFSHIRTELPRWESARSTATPLGCLAGWCMWLRSRSDSWPRSDPIRFILFFLTARIVIHNLVTFSLGTPPSELCDSSIWKQNRN